MFYVIQVKEGTEEKMIDKITRFVGADIVEEAFVPKYDKPMKVHGAWTTDQRTLFPGYVIVKTKDIKTLAEKLQKTSFLARLLGNEKEPVPLSLTEQTWLDTCTSKDNRVIGVSEGIIKGDKIVIEKGPLKGHTSWISSVNRHKATAYLTIDMFGQSIKTQAGLNITTRIP